MDLLIIFAPGMIGAGLLEVLQKDNFSAFTFFKHVLILDLFANLGSIFVYQYIFRGENSVLEHFNDNRFLLLYAGLNLFLTVLLSIFYYLIAPHISLSIENRKSRKESANEN